jgi:hypothetical protein
MITIAFQTYVFSQLASCAHSHYLTAVLVEHRPPIAGAVVVRGVNQTVTRHKMTNLSFFPMKTCVLRVANMIINYIFSAHLQCPCIKKNKALCQSLSIRLL